MTTLILEGADNWNGIADAAGKGWTVTGDAITGALAAGRFAGQCVGQSNGAFEMQKSIPNQTTLYLGAAFNCDSSVYVAYKMLAAFGNATNVNINKAVSGGGLYFHPASGSDIHITSYVEPADNVWTYLEMEVTAGYDTSAHAGSVTIWQDGVQIYTNAAVQTTADSADNYFNAVQFGAAKGTGSGAKAGFVDDMYVSNSQRMGPMRICTLYPAADSGTPAWTPNSGTNGYSRVNETLNDGDTSYVHSTANSQAEKFTFGSLPGSGIGNPLSVQSTIVAKGLGNTLQATITNSGTTFTGGSHSLTSSYATYTDILDTLPDGSTAWTISAVNAIVAGFVNGAP